MEHFKTIKDLVTSLEMDFSKMAVCPEAETVEQAERQLKELQKRLLVFDQRCAQLKECMQFFRGAGKRKASA